MTTSIVITGATGFIGRALCKRLEEKKEFSIIKVTRSTKLKSGFCHVTSYQKTPPGDILIHYCVLHETRFVRSRYEYRLPPFRIFNGSSHRRPLRSDLGSGGELMN